jgi:hypothetical protein
MSAWFNLKRLGSAALATRSTSLATAAILALGAFAASANAATIVETFTLPTVDGFQTVDGSSFAAFDPALGTLDFVTYDITTNALFSGGGESDENAANYQFLFEGPGGGPAGFQTSVIAFGNTSGEEPESLGEGSPSVLAVFTGPGLVHPSVDVSHGLGSASVVSTFTSTTVTYTFTPAVPAAPEPSTWAMMLIGFAALGYAGCRASRKSAALAA